MCAAMRLRNAHLGLAWPRCRSLPVIHPATALGGRYMHTSRRGAYTGARGRANAAAADRKGKKEKVPEPDKTSLHNPRRPYA